MTNKIPRFRVHISVSRDEVVSAMTLEEAVGQLWDSIMNGGEYTIDGEELEEEDGASGVSATPDVLDYLSAIREGDPRTDQ